MTNIAEWDADFKSNLKQSETSGKLKAIHRLKKAVNGAKKRVDLWWLEGGKTQRGRQMKLDDPLCVAWRQRGGSELLVG